MAAEPSLAIVGSADPARATELNLKDPAGALQAARELGAELAQRGCGLILYSFAPTFIEKELARGYLQTRKAKPNSIKLIYPHAQGEPDLDDCKPFREAFEFVPDRHAAWEMSFYESIQTVDGILLIGGGHSTLVAGILSVLDRCPIVALAGFGGAASEVWPLLPETVTQDERNLMGQPQWSGNAAKRCVDALLRQRDQLLKDAAEQQRKADEAKRSETARQQQKARESIAAAVALVLALGITIWLWSAPPDSSGLMTVFLFLTPFLSGVSGAMFRRILDGFPNLIPGGSSAITVAALGLAAGGLTGLVYEVSQLTAFPEAIEGASKAAIDHARIEHASKILPTAMVAGFIAGLTLDAVFRKFIKRGNEPVQGDEG